LGLSKDSCSSLDAARCLNTRYNWRFPGASKLFGAPAQPHPRKNHTQWHLNMPPWHHQVYTWWGRTSAQCCPAGAAAATAATAVSHATRCMFPAAFQLCGLQTALVTPPPPHIVQIGREVPAHLNVSNDNSCSLNAARYVTTLYLVVSDLSAVPLQQER
jgi:hypothetical protein